MSEDKTKETPKEETPKPEILFKHEFLPEDVYRLLQFIHEKELEFSHLIRFREALSRSLTNREEVTEWEKKKQEELKAQVEEAKEEEPKKE